MESRERAIPPPSTSNGGSRPNHRSRRNRQHKSNSGNNDLTGPENDNSNGPARSANRPNQRTRKADPSKVVRKPQNRNNSNLSRRQQELKQLKKGFPSLEEDENDPTKFRLQFSPSDPDFAFDIQQLYISLYVPLVYPPHVSKQSARSSSATVEYPQITVLNEDIPKGFSANVDIGFRSIAQDFVTNGKSLLDMINQLDRDLEGFLKQEKRATIKIIKPNKPKAILHDGKNDLNSKELADPMKFTLDSQPSIFIPPEIKQERIKQIEKLRHVLSNASSMYQASSDKTEEVFHLSVDVLDSSKIPAEMNGKIDFNLHVPFTYGLSSPSYVIFPVYSEDFPTHIIERNFNEFLANHTSWKLFSAINYLASRIPELLSEDFLSEANNVPSLPLVPSAGEDDTIEKSESVNDETKEKAKKILSSMLARKKKQNTNNMLDTSDMSISSEDEDRSKHMDVGIPEDESQKEHNDDQPLKQRNTAVFLPGVTMTNVKILECTSISLIVLCKRCSSPNDLFNITSGPYGKDSKPVAASCVKCKATLACSFQKDLMDAFAEGPKPVGYLDVYGCIPSQVLASIFVPTCLNCSTSNLESAFKRADLTRVTTSKCPTCKIRLTLRLGEDGYVFEQLNDEVLSEERLRGVRVRKSDSNKQRLGLVAGQPLPDDGKCTHFRKSTRWFRFACCGKVYACEKCHDFESNHPYEYGTQIICGMCSREQSISDSCQYCRHKFDNRNNTGFWEGGKGTRDPTKLNKNDRRKFKKLPSKQNGTGSKDNDKKGGQSRHKGKSKDQGRSQVVKDE